MNKKVLSAILFSALFAGAGTFTSCIDNDEPAGIEDLRGAKAELLRAKIEVEKAEASLKLAMAEVQRAEAARLESLARINEASARLEEARAEAAEIKNDADRADLEKTIAEYEMYLEEATLAHELTMIQTQQNLAVVKRNYEIALKQIAIAEALMSESAMETLAGLKGNVSWWMVEVERLEHEVEKQQDVLYNAAKYIGAETKYQIAQAEIALNNQKAVLEAKELEVEKYKKYMEIDSTATESDWRKEIAEIEAEVAEYDKKIAEYQLELVKAMESEETKALAKAVKAEQDTLAAAKKAQGELVLAEEVSYTFKFWDGNPDEKITFKKDLALDSYGERLAGSDYLDEDAEVAGLIKDIQNAYARYTEEYKAYLKALAADEDLDDLDKKQADYADAKAKWAAALTAYNTAKTTAADVSLATPKAAYEAYKTAMTDAGQTDYLDVTKTGNRDKVLKAKQAFADALVAWYNTLPADQVTFNKLTLKIETTINGTDKTEYITKTAKDWLSDSSNKDVYLIEIVKQCFNANGASNGFNAYWGEGSEFTKPNDLTADADDKYTTAKDAFGKIVSKTALINAKAKDLVNKSSAAFGVATNYIDATYAATVKVDGVDCTYLTVEPSEADVKRILNYPMSAGKLGAYLAYTDEGVIFEAKNLDAILADYTAAETFFTEELTEVRTSVNTAVAAVETAEEHVKAAQKAYQAHINAIDAKFMADKANLNAIKTSLNNIKWALINVVDKYLAENYTGEENFMDYLANQLKIAEEAIPELVYNVEKAEVDLEAAKEGKFFTAHKVEKEQELLTKLEEDLAEAIKGLEKAIVDLATAEEIWAGK